MLLHYLVKHRCPENCQAPDLSNTRCRTRLCHFLNFLVLNHGKLSGVEQRAPPIFGMAAITLGIGPNFKLRPLWPGPRPTSVPTTKWDHWC